MSSVLLDVQPFAGQHCETTATGTLMNAIGIALSEPMLFGLGEGLSFIYWNMKTMDSPFFGGRIKPDGITQNLAKNLGLTLGVKETSSVSKAWNNVKTKIDAGVPVGLKLDCYHLDYFTVKIHFAGHYVAMIGYDDTYAYLIDTDLQRVKTTLGSLALARNETGPMSSKNLSYTIGKGIGDVDIKAAVAAAIRANAQAYLNPPITNISYKGILKASQEIKKWFRNSKSIEAEFSQAAMLMEEGGTGGAIFRNLYRDFLGESAVLLKNDSIAESYKLFCVIAPLWSNVAELFRQTAQTQSAEPVNQASDILAELSDMEKRAMGLLSGISA